MSVELHVLGPQRRGLEVVERKGPGHPDTLADAAAEAFSARLSRFYLEHFGRVLHHNVDKVLLRGGASAPAFGGGELLEPVELYLAGRAVTSHGGVEVPVEELAEAAVADVLARHLRFLEVGRDVRVHTLVRPGSVDLRELFGVGALCNDTSIGVGYAPLSTLERAVLTAEDALTSPRVRDILPGIGEDLKVLGVVRNGLPELTVAAATVDRFVPDVDAYLDLRGEIGRLVHAAVEPLYDRVAQVRVNVGDGPGRYYLTVTGTSAEAGDDGQVGRGNRQNGLITPMRPMSLEAVAGKNPVTHVGKLYNLVASRAAGRLAAREDVEAAQVVVVSRIGAPVTEPWVTEVGVRPALDADLEGLRTAAGLVVEQELAGLEGLMLQLVRGELDLGFSPRQGSG